jgi:hypothetical protein
MSGFCVGQFKRVPEQGLFLSFSIAHYVITLELFSSVCAWFLGKEAGSYDNLLCPTLATEVEELLVATVLNPPPTGWVGKGERR